jgi:hypothetical protein
MGPGVLLALVVISRCGKSGRAAAAQMTMMNDIVTTSPDATFTRRPDRLRRHPRRQRIYGASEGAEPFQHPSPVLCVMSDTVTIVLQNTLPVDLYRLSRTGRRAGERRRPSPSWVAASLTSLTRWPANGGSVTQPGPAIGLSLQAVALTPASTVTGLASTEQVTSTTVLTDTLAFGGLGFTSKEYLIGLLLTNNADLSSCTIAAVGTSTLVCAGPLAGGTDNLWTTGDGYTISVPPGPPEEMFANKRLERLISAGLFSRSTLLTGGRARARFNMNYHKRYWMIGGRNRDTSHQPPLAAASYGTLARPAS